MTPEKPIESRALVVMCAARDVKLKQLAVLLGIQPATLYEYADGTKTPPRWLLEMAAAVLGFPPQHVDRTLDYLRQSDSSAVSGGGDPEARAAAEIDGIAHSLGQEWEGLSRDVLWRSRTRMLAFVKRQAAPVLWSRLRLHPREVRPAVVKENQEFHEWSLAELLCHESIEAASDDADEAVALAELACLVADLVPDTEPLQLRTRGYARFYLGNALRVKGESLPSSDEAFRQAEPPWKAGAAGDPERLLNEARVLSMEASLRRAQRRLPEALTLIDRALAVGRGELRASLLINRGKVLEEMEDYQGTLATLREALPLLDGEREPRLFLSARFNVLVALCHLEKFDEVAATQIEVRHLAAQLGKRLILARIDWLQGWAASGCGRLAEAEKAFDRARQEFLSQGIAFDSGLVSLELAVLYLQQNRTAEVKTLARELAPVFNANQVTREAYATGVLFLEAVQQETISLEMARRLLEDYRKQRLQQCQQARSDPDRRKLRRPGKSPRNGH